MKKYIRYIKQILSRLEPSSCIKKYKCSDCHKTNFFEDKIISKDITFGFCWNCEHPIWN
jgi:hypothetical protein